MIKQDKKFLYQTESMFKIYNHPPIEVGTDNKVRTGYGRWFGTTGGLGLVAQYISPQRQRNAVKLHFIYTSDKAALIVHFICLKIIHMCSNYQQ